MLTLQGATKSTAVGCQLSYHYHYTGVSRTGRRAVNLGEPMKPGVRQRLTIVLVALPILALCVAILLVVVANTDMVYPTPSAKAPS